jgi:hypothetical protein
MNQNREGGQPIPQAPDLIPAGRISGSLCGRFVRVVIERDREDIGAMLVQEIVTVHGSGWIAVA